MKFLRTNLLLAFACTFSLTSIATLNAKHTHSCHESSDVYDYIIVGNGTAGAVLARKLSDNHKNKVLVLETGSNLSEDPAVLDPNTYVLNLDGLTDLNSLTFEPKYAINYIVQLPTPFQVSYYSEGRMWGGGSAHNYLLAARASPSIYDTWASISGNPQWSYNNLLPTMQELETYTPNLTSANPSQRGFNGPIFVTQTPPVDEDPFIQASAIATNSPLISDYSDAAEGDIGYSAQQLFVTPPFNSPNSYRSFSVNAFLPKDVVSEDGHGRRGRKLQIESNSFVSHLLFNEKKGKKKKVVGVEYIQSPDSTRVLKAFAKKKVILCAGAIHTPAILQRSGIGDAALLDSLGIRVVVNNPNVGANLANHYGVTAVILGSLEPGTLATGFIDASPYMPADGVRRLQTYSIDGGPVIIMVIFNEQPKSRGDVKITNRNPLVYPDVNLNMFSDGPLTQVGSDSYLAVSSFKIAQNIAAEFGSILLSPPPADFADDNILLSDAKNNPYIVVSDHISGTTQMGRTLQDGVVDGKLHVFGVKNLMIADLGVAPVTPNANPCYDVYLIALTAASILEE